jgi:hypothetical protein
LVSRRITGTLMIPSISLEHHRRYPSLACLSIYAISPTQFLIPGRLDSSICFYIRFG